MTLDSDDACVAEAPAGRVGDTWMVVAIEAHPRRNVYLERNVSLNAYPNIVSVHAAVGEREGTACFSNYSSDDQNAVSDEPTGGAALHPGYPRA